VKKNISSDSAKSRHLKP